MHNVLDDMDNKLSIWKGKIKTGLVMFCTKVLDFLVIGVIMNTTRIVFTFHTAQ